MALIGAALLLGSAFAAWRFGSATPPAQAAEPAPSRFGNVLPIAIEGTRLVVHKPDGRQASESELIGSSLVVSVDGAPPRPVRIDGIERDPRDETGEIFLYELSARDQASGQWVNVCPADPAGMKRGFPVAGTWTATGEHIASPGAIELACTNGAVGKCLRMGYHPWKSQREWARHQACTRMLRADYCGDGKSRTRQGTLVNVYDRDGTQKNEPAPGMDFEAGWGEDGATCVRHTRIPEDFSLADLLSACPRKLAGRTGPACTESSALADPRTLVMNMSLSR